MKKMNLPFGHVLVLILCAAPRGGASAQAATEYGLTSGSSATTTSSAGTTLNRKLGQTANSTISHAGATIIVQNPRPSSSKVRSTNTKNGQNTVARMANRVPKQASVDGSPPAALGVPQGSFTVVGAEGTSHEATAVAHRTVASQSGFTVVGEEPR